MKRRTFMQSVGAAVSGRKLPSTTRQYTMSNALPVSGSFNLLLTDDGMKIYANLLASQVERVESKGNGAGTHTHSFIFHDTGG